jgi:hypothetical protein
MIERLRPYFILLAVLAAIGQAACNPASIQPTASPALSTTVPAPRLPSTDAPSPVPEGQCANPLVPLLPGYKWTYASTGTARPSRVEISVISVGSSKANLQIMDVDQETATQAAAGCVQGAIIDFPPIFFRMLLADIMNAFVSTETLYGVYVPSKDTLVKNGWVYLWNRVELAQEGVRITLPGSGGEIFTSVNREVLFITKIGSAPERVTIPAGTYPQAVRVSQVVKLPVTQLTASGSEDGELMVEFSQWYEPYVGLLKMQVENAGLSFDPGASTPVAVKAAIALTRFQPGR